MGCLTGTVTDARRLWSKEEGPDIHVLQLHVDQELGGHKGYSGSPVVLGRSHTADDTSAASWSSPVLGVLIEQLQLRSTPQPGQPKRPASNVLFAIPIQDALDRFGLDTLWVSVGDVPPDAEVVPQY